MQPGYNPYALDPWGRPIPLGNSLRGLGIALQVAFGVLIVTNVNQIFALLHQRHVVDQIIAVPGSVTRAQADSADNRVSVAAALFLLAHVLVIVLWLVWFHGARANAEAYDPAANRHSIGWSIGAWFTPIIGLWRPFQIATETLRAADRRNEQGGYSYQNYPLLRVWWGLYLIGDIFGGIVVAAYSNNSTAANSRSHISWNIALVVVVAVSAIAAILVVRRMTASNEAKRQWLQEQYADWVRASTRPAGGGPTTAWGS